MWFIISIFAVSGLIIFGTDENGRPNIIFRVGILMILTVPLIIFAFCLKSRDVPLDECEYAGIVTDVYVTSEVVDKTQGVWNGKAFRVTFRDGDKTYKDTVWPKDSFPDGYELYGALIKHTYHTIVKVGDNIYEDNSEKAFNAFKESKGQTVNVTIGTYATEDGNSETRISKINETVIWKEEEPKLDILYDVKEK